MSNCLKRIREEIKTSQLLFPPDMYTNAFGSLAICAYIFTYDKKGFPIQDVRRIWFKVKKHPEKFITWDVDDPDFIDKTLFMFGLQRPPVFSIAMVRSAYNVLFAPFDKKDQRLYPLREDGFCGITLSSGKIYPVDFTGHPIPEDLRIKAVD